MTSLVASLALSVGASRHRSDVGFSSDPSRWARHCCAALPSQGWSSISVPSVVPPLWTCRHLPNARIVPSDGTVQRCAGEVLHVMIWIGLPLAPTESATSTHFAPTPLIGPLAVPGRSPDGTGDQRGVPGLAEPLGRGVPA